MAVGERESLAKALRSIRRHRGLQPSQVAKAMGMRTSTYENFESGRGPATYARLTAFAAATDCAALVSAHPHSETTSPNASVRPRWASR